MDNLWTLYRFEWKKLMKRKLIWITFALCAVVTAFSICVRMLGGYYGSVNGQKALIDTNYNMYKIDKAYADALSGQPIDQALLEQTIAAYRKIPLRDDVPYSLTEEFQQYARPYSPIFQFIMHTTDLRTTDLLTTWEPDEQDLYARRLSWLEDLMADTYLTAGETQFWHDQEAKIAKPIVYQEHMAYETLISVFQTVGMMVLLLNSISLAGIFHDEHTRKTDQLILCCPLGKRKLYLVKIAVGVSYAVLSALLLTLLTLAFTFGIYGTQGFQAPFQLIYAQSADPITCGQAALIAYGGMVVAGALVGVIVMILSEVLRSNIAALSLSVGLLMFCSIVNIPEQYRLAAQIWDWLPWQFLSPWSVFDMYTLPLFGAHLTPWQAVPILYILAGAVIVLAGRACYQRYQISGR